MNDLKVIENDLVPVYETSNGEKVVYGSELHKVLCVKSRYREWIDRRLVECDAVEGTDYEAAEISAPSGQKRREHIILLDTAKEMAMLERNEKGKKVRRYFIEIEKKYKQQIQPMSQLEIARMSLDMLIKQEKRLIAIEEKQSSFDEEINQINAKLEKHQENWYTIAGYASLLGIDVSLQEAGKLGRKASKLARENDIKLDTTPDPRYGTVKVYPRWILESVFEEY